MKTKLSFRIIFYLSFALLVVSCNRNNSHLYKKYYGIYIDHELRNGADYKDSTGIKYWYTYVHTELTNDSTISVHVRVELPVDTFQTETNGAQYKVFLLTDSMALSVESTDYYLVSGKLKEFFDSGMKNPFVLDTVLQPGENSSFYIAVITKFDNGLAPYLSLFTKGHKPHFWPSRLNHDSKLAPDESLFSIPDSAINANLQLPSKGLNLFLGLNFINNRIQGSDVTQLTMSKMANPVNNYNVIPCGWVSY